MVLKLFFLFYLGLLSPLQFCFAGPEEIDTEVILKSIAQHGLRSPSHLPKEAQPKVNPLFILGSSLNEPEVCLNYLNFEPRLGQQISDQEIRDTFHIAVFEESRGIFGISHERVWPFYTNNREIWSQTELPERLNSSILLVMRPPHIRKLEITQEALAVNESLHLAELKTGAIVAQYTSTSDGIYQGRLRCMDEAFQLESNRRQSKAILEIKTQYRFSPKEVIAVLAPSRYFNMTREIFKPQGVRVIEVKSKQTPINWLTHLLSYLHNEELFKGRIEYKIFDEELYKRYRGPVLSLSTPDYEGALLQFYQENPSSHQAFSLHAVRLPTKYDFSVRFIQSLKDSQPLLEAVKAQILETYPSGEGWVVVNKLFTTDYSKLGAGLAVHPTNTEFLRNLRVNFQYHSKLFEQLKKAKGDKMKMSKVKTSLTNDQKNQLHIQAKAFIIRDFNETDWIAYPEENTAIVNKIL